jgi:hypothetical protein
MDRELWASVLRAVKRAAAEVGWNGGRRRPVYPNGLIVAMYLWSAWHDRTLCWACRRGSYGALFRPRDLPSVSHFSRRVRSADCQRILQLAHDAFAQRPRVAHLPGVDGKALPVGPASGDRNDADGEGDQNGYDGDGPGDAHLQYRRTTPALITTLAPRRYAATRTA